MAASVLSAPLLCLFTLPLFFIGFPRQNKFWPEAVGASASVCADTLYYQHLSLELSKTIRSVFANGSLGEPHVGNHYLMRFQDRLIWTMIVERGCGYCSVSIKGLELQETSCHTVEAARIDDQFQEAFEVTSFGACSCIFNNYPLHVLTPLDVGLVKTYSDAKNILTGVIDSPDSVKVTLEFFAKSLIWILLNHVNKLKIQEEEVKKRKEKEIREMEAANKKHLSKISEIEMKDTNSNKRRDKVSWTNNSREIGINHNLMMLKKLAPPTDAFSLPPINSKSALVQDSRPGSGDSNSSKKSSLSSSIQSFTDSIWSDEETDRVKRKSSSLKQHKVSTIVSINRSQKHSPLSVLTTLPPVPSHNTSLYDEQIRTSSNDVDFGLPVVDVNVAHSRPYVDFDESFSGARGTGEPKPAPKFMVPTGNHIYKPVMNLAGSPDFKCQYSSHVSVPVKWRELPIEPSQLSRYTPQFPVSWFKHILYSLDWSLTGLPNRQAAKEVSGDEALTNCYNQLVMACYSAFDTPGRPGGANFLYKAYNGDVPWNAMMDWLSEEKDLHKLVIKAFRYGFKLMLDQTLLGDISDNEELESYLKDYEDNWYIGRETDPDWALAVLEQKENLFSLGHNGGQGTYTSRMLSLQELPVYMGRVNQESVKAQWANLNLELLYMTNDDEERYSIQAQPAILRNLTVQAADPPLGYPIYSSPPISIPTI